LLPKAETPPIGVELWPSEAAAELEMAAEMVATVVPLLLITDLAAALGVTLARAVTGQGLVLQPLVLVGEAEVVKMVRLT